MDADLIELVWERARGRCEYCCLSPVLSHLPFEIDHIIAKQHGGRTVPGNLALACYRCNKSKGPNLSSIDEQTGRIVPLFHPRRHKWTSHFRWQGGLLVGRTPQGRATVALLTINLPILVALRESLIEEGVFPPDD